ncbi:hypothetical protein R5R35_000010 [Gryllus longicercus]|uniref:Metalloendopeptidase n=1 Tax=Gryllus longicercus TaxID=2509291 RepID=A0AAN9Z4H8_9ORTH
MQPLTVALSLALCALSACADVVPPAPRHAGHDLLHHDGDWGEGGRAAGAGRWQDSGYFQGDIMLPANVSARNGLLSTAARWPNRVMPYYIDPSFTSAQRAVIESAVADYNARTCVTMRPYQSGDSRYIWIKGDNTGCWSYVGAQSGGQVVNLQRNGCVYKGTAIHEFLHAWGFHHQQCATERDNYVTIQWGNIQSGMEHNFDKYSSSVITNFGVAYDYGSIMHYDAYAFSKNGQKTIVAPQSIGQSSGFSSSDILKLEKMYGCR